MKITNKPIVIKLQDETPNFKKFHKESKEIGKKILEAADLAAKYEHNGTAEWLRSLAKEFEKECPLVSFKELL